MRINENRNTITATQVLETSGACANRSDKMGSIEYARSPGHGDVLCQKKSGCDSWAFLFCVPFALCGCAFHHFDKETGVEHIWGFGHMKLKVAQPEGPLQAIVHGMDVFGLSVGSSKFEKYATLGWHSSQYIDIHKRSTQFLLEWRGDDFTHVYVGFDFPTLTTRPVDTDTEKTEPE